MHQELTNTAGSKGEPLFFNYDRGILIGREIVESAR
jgi:hypothetical protein